jgi:lipopolysaccharide/colanic/teichoic acid biosynthesis glycosyltransferase
MKAERQKRAFDLVFGLGIFAALSPLYLLCMLLVWLTIGRPVHFRQTRLGRYGKPFQMYKFRTMDDRQDSDGRFLPDPERINPQGRLMRHASLDELPQLINVIKGEMSLVGPRPQLACFTEHCTPHELRRFAALPGMTGLAQISGRNAITWKQKFRFDAWYADHHSLWLDLMIIIKTIPAVLKRRGIEKAVPETITIVPAKPGGAAVISLDPDLSVTSHPEGFVQAKARATTRSARG